MCIIGSWNLHVTNNQPLSNQVSHKPLNSDHSSHPHQWTTRARGWWTSVSESWCHRGAALEWTAYSVQPTQLKFHCLLLSAHIVRAVEALKTTRSCLNHLELPKLSHCVSLWKTHSPLWRWIAPTSRTHHHLGPYPSPLFFCPLHSWAQNLFQAQIKQLSIHAAATTRTAVKTCFVTLRTAPDRQTVRCIQIPQV